MMPVNNQSKLDSSKKTFEVKLPPKEISSDAKQKKIEIPKKLR